MSLAVGPVLLLAGCGGGGDVEIAAPALSAADARTCAAFLAALPATLDDLAPRAVTPPEAGRAYGDPAITVTCGVDVPSTYYPGAVCQRGNGVGWFVPDADLNDQDVDATLTAVGYRPVVQVVVPHDYRPAGPAAVISQLARPVRTTLRLVMGCR